MAIPDLPWKTLGDFRQALEKDDFQARVWHVRVFPRYNGGTVRIVAKVIKQGGEVESEIGLLPGCPANSLDEFQWRLDDLPFDLFRRPDYTVLPSEDGLDAWFAWRGRMRAEGKRFTLKWIAQRAGIPLPICGSTDEQECAPAKNTGAFTLWLELLDGEHGAVNRVTQRDAHRLGRAKRDGGLRRCKTHGGHAIWPICEDSLWENNPLESCPQGTALAHWSQVTSPTRGSCGNADMPERRIP